MADTRASERLRHVRELFQVALELTPETRGAFLVAATVDDPSLGVEVERLLRALDRTSDLLEDGVSKLLSRTVDEGDERPPAF